MSRTVIAEMGADVTGKLVLGGLVAINTMNAFFDGMEERRVEDLTAVERLVVELGRARHAAAAHAAEADRLRRELSNCGRALGAERARAERAERALDGVARAAGYVRAA